MNHSNYHDFVKIRTSNFIYIDKTRYIKDLLETEDTLVFLSRSRRFGKSLFVQTLHRFFLGEEFLFKGLQIYPDGNNKFIPIDPTQSRDRCSKWIRFPII